MYTQFAKIYDRLMGDLDYPAWARHYLRLLQLCGVQPQTLCECGCGTGLLSVELARLGPKLTASDLSTEMLQIAAQRARQNGLTIPFVAMDMRRIALHRPVDALVCGCDGVNYLCAQSDLSAFFAAAQRCLKPGGAIAFDISSAHKLRGMCEQKQFFEDMDELTYLWTNSWDEPGGCVEMELSCFLRGDDGRYDRFDEHQRQRAHDAASIERALRDAGFADVRRYGDMTEQPPLPDAARIHFTAIRK